MQSSYSTERLILHDLQLEDHAFITVLVNTPGWIRFIGERYVHSQADAEAYITKIMKNPLIHYWVVRLKETGESIGVITFIKRDYLDHYDLGFAFLPEYSGKGYAFEAACVILENVKEDKAHEYILATTIRDNFSSIKLVEKLGLKFERSFENNGESLLLFSMKIN